MKKLAILCILLCAGMLSAQGAFAWSWTIEDTYIGNTSETADRYLWNDGDVVAGSLEKAEDFDIKEMTVDITGDIMSVFITTNYYTNIANFGTTFGDLFIGDASTDAEWDYAFDISGEKLYNISDAADAIIDSDMVGDTPALHAGGRFASSEWPYSWYRHYEEVLVDPNGLASIGEGQAGRAGDYFVMSFDISALDLGTDFDLTLHWGQTCGNDVIEGSVSHATPEPGTMLLLGFGVAGLAWVSRKRFK